jgi:hypothetical protein
MQPLSLAFLKKTAHSTGTHFSRDANGIERTHDRDVGEDIG